LTVPSPTKSRPAISWFDRPAGAVPRFEGGELPGAGVGGEGLEPVAVDVGEGELRAGVRSFAADDDAQAGWPAVRFEVQAVRLRMPESSAPSPPSPPSPPSRRPVDPERGGPGVLGQGEDRGLDLVGHREPDGVVQVQPGTVVGPGSEAVQVVQPCLPGACAVGADQYRLAVEFVSGICASARAVISMCSAAVFAPAFAGAQDPARASFVLSRNARIGW
jgi:hypothetical protein